MRLLVTVTFNPNQLRSHLAPLIAIPEVSEIVLVADREPPDLPKVRAVVPGPAMQRSLGRAGSKLATCTRLARSLRPDWIISYNIMPHGLNGHIAGRLSGRRTMYHMIGGTKEWVGGGYGSDNAILGRLPRPVAPVERALWRVLEGSTVVGTMGSGDRDLLLAAGLPPGRVEVFPPSVDTRRFTPAPEGAEAPYAIVSAASLIPRKRLHDLIEVVARLRVERPWVRAAIAGQGPLLDELRAQASALGVADAIDFLGQRSDVEDLYRSSRVFVLTTRSEGLSVAMSEAMACGLPAVVSDVGDLGDLVSEGRNGHLLAVGDVAGFTERIAGLLDDPVRYRAASQAAREDAVRHSGVERLTNVYRRILLDQPAHNGGRA
jgi:glycosyltransferase involved in cell wall biosynthesis